MKDRFMTIFAASAVVAGAMAVGGCDAMWDTSVDVPLGYGGSIGVGVSAPIFPPSYGWQSPFWGPGWGPGWGVGPVRPPLRPGIVRPPVQRPPVNNPGQNWRPPGNNQPTRPPMQINPAPVRPPATGSTPTVPVSPVTRPGRH